MPRRLAAIALFVLGALLPATASAETLPGFQPPVPTGSLQYVTLPLLCASPFIDVQPGNAYYDAVSWLYCHGVVAGYADQTFRPYDNLTRAQFTRWVVSFRGWPLVTPPVGSYIFEDVPPASPFFQYIETAAKPGIASGYMCGGVGEPCDALNRPYFRPNAYMTRAQAVKMLVAAEAWPLSTPPSPSFADVPAGSAFFQYIETAFARGIVSGYTCGAVGEPCDSANRPYFRQFQDITRGQGAKILYLSR